MLRNIKFCVSSRYGHLLLTRLLDVLDDTVAAVKGPLAELLDSAISASPSAAALAAAEATGTSAASLAARMGASEASPLWQTVTGHHSRKVLLHILAPRSTKYFDPAALHVLREAVFAQSKSSVGSTIHADGTGGSEDTEFVSKKPAEVRRAELLVALRSPLFQLAETRGSEMARSRYDFAKQIFMLGLALGNVFLIFLVFFGWAYRQAADILVETVSVWVGK